MALPRLRHASAFLLFFLLLSSLARAQGAGILPFIDPHFTDSNGDPLSGGTLTFYAAGTTTPIDVFSDSTRLTPLANPLTLDSSGKTTTEVYFGVSSYKIVVKDANGITIRTADNITDTAYLAQLSVAPGVQTTTSTGTVNDFTLVGSPIFGTPYSTLVVRCNNASALFITGFSAGINGQRLIVLSVGAGDVFLTHQSLSSSAQNRMINLQTQEQTPLLHGAGVAEFVYDAVTFRWRMVRAEMGNYGTYTPTWAAQCVSGPCTLPDIGNGVLSGRYYITGRIVYVDIHMTIGSTTTFGTGTLGFWFFSLPLQAVDTTAQVGGSAMVLDNGTRYWHLVPTLFTTTQFTLNMTDNSSQQAAATVPMTWTTNDSAAMSFWYFVP